MANFRHPPSAAAVGAPGITDAIGENHVMFFVTGASGNAGRAVVRALLDSGQDVRALVREGREDAMPDGAEPVAGDLNRPETFAHALGGADGVFLLSGYEGLDELLARLDGARVVLLSSSAAPGGDTDNAVARYHILSERAVRGSGLPWTFLQPNSFMTNTFRWVGQLRAGDTVTLPFAGVAISTIDPADIAAVAARALVTGDLDGRSLRLSGPRALLPAEQVAIVAATLGRDVGFRAQSDEDARAEMLAGMPEPYVDAFFDFFVDGAIDETTVQPTVQAVLGRAPRTYERWVEDNADALHAAAA
jgi:uncharacterized protein YbjT (DUF2867 family)